MILIRFLVVLVLMLLALGGASEARASPLGTATEDRRGDGDLDADDLVGRATLGRSALRRVPGGETWVSLGGFTRRTMLGEREVGGLVVVGLPLDRIARGGARAASPLGPAALGPPVATNVVVSSAESEPALLSARVARAAVEAAWRAASLDPDDARLDAIVSRARWSAVLPETRLRAIRYDDQRLSTDASTETSRLRDSTGANLGLEARLTWRLDRLLYADDEPAFERMRLERHDARARIAGRVLEALFHWQRAWLEVRWAQAASREAREPPNRPSRDEVEASLRVVEAEATLDVLTAGWFTSTRSRVVVTRPVTTSSPSLPESL
ncbi:MAG TPA: hypothetical protein VLT33_16325 [Labilithrix sp.]|nr:hypothetical protein [Labilithrix sp.]